MFSPSFLHGRLYCMESQHHSEKRYFIFSSWTVMFLSFYSDIYLHMLTGLNIHILYRDICCFSDTLCSGYCCVSFNTGASDTLVSDSTHVQDYLVKLSNLTLEILLILAKDTIWLVIKKYWCSVPVKSDRKCSAILRLPACSTSLYSKCWWWFLGCLVGWWPPTLLFPCTPVRSVSLLAFCNFATCSFSRLFSSSSSSPAIKKVESQSNVKYNAPGSLVKRSSTFSQFPTEKSKTFDFLNEEWVMESSDCEFGVFDQGQLSEKGTKCET